MRYNSSNALLIFLFTLTLVSCKKDNSDGFKELLMNNEWTQKVDILESDNYGRIKMFYSLSFLDNGFCVIIFDNLGVTDIPDPIILDTVQVRYFIENDMLLFPDPYSQIWTVFPGTSDTLYDDAYFCDWHKKDISGNIIHLIRQENSEKEGFIFGLGVVYLEPIK